MKKFALLTSVALSTFSANTASADVIRTFDVKGQTVQIVQEIGGTGCPAYYYFSVAGKEIEFGTCAENITKATKQGNKIIVVMDGFGDDVGTYQFTYQNGKVTEKRIK